MNMQEFLSMESGDVLVDVEVPEVAEVTEGEVLEAEAVFEETVEEETEEDQEDLIVEEGTAQAEDLVESMENFIQILEHGIETQQYSPQFAATVHVALEQYNEAMGIQVPAVSLENYSHDNLADFYVASLEDMANKLNDIGQVVDTAIPKMISRMVGAKVEARRTKAANAIQTRADAVLNSLPTTRGKVEVSIKGLERALGVSGSVPTNITGAASANLKAVGELAKVSSGVLSYLNNISGTLHKAVSYIRDKNPDEAEAVTNGMTLKTPFDSLSSALTSGSGLLGNKRVLLGDAPSSGQGPEWFKAHTKRKGPKFEKIKVGASPATVSLSAADIRNLLKTVKTQAALLERTNSEVTRALRGSKIVSTQESMTRLLNEGNARRKYFGKNPTVQAARLFYRRQAFKLNDLVKMTFSHGFESANALVRLAERAAKQIGNE